MNAVHGVVSKSWEFGNSPGDETTMMDAADAVLALEPPSLAPYRHTAPRCAPTAVAPRRLPLTTKSPVKARRSPPQPETPVAPQRKPPSSTLSSDVDRVIQYLDTFRFTPAIQRVSGETRNGYPRSSERQSHLFVDTVLSDTTISDPFLVEEVGQLEGTKTIFRATPLPMPLSPLPRSIVKSNSVHSIHRKPSSPVSCGEPADDLDLSAVTNLITSMCVENEGKDFDWTFLDKIQRKVEELLREVRKEREATNEWVKAVQESVDVWVQEQRLLIECERKHAFERARQHRPVRQVAPENQVVDSSVSQAAEQKLLHVIEHQAKKIEELQSRLAAEKALETRVPVLKTPRYSQIPGSQESASSKKFFDMVEKHESPTLPHLVHKEVRPKREYMTLQDGRRLVKFRNGTEREYLPDGTLITRYPNGDVKTEGGKDKIVIYWHDKEKTKQTIFPDGVQVYEYPNQQVERHFPDGGKEVISSTGARPVHLADGTKKTVE